MVLHNSALQHIARNNAHQSLVSFELKVRKLCSGQAKVSKGNHSKDT